MFVLLYDGDSSHVTNVYRDSDGASAGWYGENTGVSVSRRQDAIAKFERIGNTVRAYFDNRLANQRTVTNWNLIYVALTDTHGTSISNQFDWIRVRKYTYPEPTVNFGNEEKMQSTSLLIISLTNANCRDILSKSYQIQEYQTFITPLGNIDLVLPQKLKIQLKYSNPKIIIQNFEWFPKGFYEIYVMKVGEIDRRAIIYVGTKRV